MGRNAIRLAAVGVAYFLAQQLGFFFPDSSRVLSALWPASGIGLAVLLLSPRRRWPQLLAVLFVSGYAAHLLAGRTLVTGAGFVTANVVEALGCAWLISRTCGPDVRFARVREIIALIAAAVFVNAGSAAIGAGTAALTGQAAFAGSWSTWWVARGLGILLIAPLVVAWSDFRDLFHELRWPRILEMALLAAVLCFGAWHSVQTTVTFRAFEPRPYMVIALLAWSALRFGQRTLMLVLVVLAAIAVTSTAVSIGPFLWMGGTPEERLLSVQLYLAFNAATGLLLGAAYTEAKSAEARVRALGDNLPQGAVYQVMRERDGGKRFLYMSAGIQELTGIAADKMLRDASAFYRLMLEEDRPAFAAAEEAAVRDLTVFQSVFRLRRRDGQVRWVQATSSPRLLGDGRVIWDGIQTDVTEHTQAVDDLRNSEARFRTLTEDAPIAICVAREARLVYVNPTFLKMFRFKSMSECLGRPALDFHAPQCRPEIAERMARRAAGLPEPREYESLGARGDGSEFPIMVAVLRMQFGEGPAMVAFITDLTARRQSEEERTRLEQQLRQAQKLESLGRLAGGVSHDFNNLLTVINGFSMLLTQKLDAHERVWSYAEQIRRAGERAASLTGQLLAFSRQEAIQPVPLNLNATIADSEQMFRSLVGEGISLTTHLDAHLGAVLADPAQIDQILLNLVVNARDAMPDGGSLMIATVNFDGAVRNDSAGEAPSCGRWVTVTIADTGIGMDEHTRQNIFEPFFTTKGVGKGTGLGLSTVYGAMQQNGGWIDVNSQPGAGSSFRLYFPRIDDQPLPPAREIPHSREAHTGGTVLLVEDEAAVRDFLRVVLEDCHYKVLEARNGVEALAVAAEEIDGIHLLVADVVMPGMNGRELAERLRRDRPALKAIFMSGHSTDVIAHSGALDDDAAFLQKPVSPDALAAKVRDVLAGG